MPLNKEIIIRVVLGVIVLFMFVKIVLPVFFEAIKRKIPGQYEPDNDIDSMIRRQKERLRAQYGLTERSNNHQETSHSSQEISSPLPPPTKEVEALYKETRWGGGDFSKKIQNDITRHYGYTLAESKVNAFIMLAEKRNYARFLTVDNQKNPEAIKNYFSVLMLVLMMIEEIRTKDLTLIERVAKKCHVSTHEFMLALQLKVLFTIKSKVKDDRLFSESPILGQFSEETMKEAVDLIITKEANMWAKNPSLFFEEMSLFLSYADIMTPLPKLQHKKDLETAYAILKMDEDSELEDIKKTYKKIAMARHPDKIGQMNLPKELEKKALSKFNHIQEAYDLILTSRKK
ncbi:hypothetical protein DOM21_05980 [Bacteriovorax stolpii]|uniref:DnaJ domain-containing protein n=1 Tax=Bacteriovorax stolpii TaxID=960 RepID=UPI0011582370|nr:DnaJ domain-containing protein [Bacteriovorax stolpii]QDK41009.1 hypothetical protein DOM21_05980 [Bacteriovorax stolpii]